jgi:methionyl aminopeptidase
MLVRLKTGDEIEGFAKAGRLAAQILRQLAEAAKDDVTTAQLDRLAKEACAVADARPVFLGYQGFPAAICTSIGNELVHGIPGSHILRNGELLKIDIGVELDGFIGDTALTLRVGGSRFDNLDQMVFDCRTALICGIAAARPGCDLGDIGEEISRIAHKGGWKVVVQYGGHGLDRGVLHADPFVDNVRARSLRLRPGMVLAIEPMFVAGPDADTKVGDDGWTVLTNGPAVHFEHSIVVSELGEPRILTKMEEE